MRPDLAPPPPVITGHLLHPLHAELITLLRRLGPAEWSHSTEVPGWSVRRVVAHLVDTMLRRLSLHRDGHLPPPPSKPIDSGSALLESLNQLNADWVEATDRLSPGVLVAILERFGPELADFLAQLPPHDEAKWPVVWAGEVRSENWMDVGREYTERWHHQQQIRAAVGSPLLIAAHWLGPIIHLGAFALPVSYASLEAPVGTRVRVTVSGPAGGAWMLVKEPARWRLTIDGADPTAEVALPEELAWRTWYSSRRPRLEASVSMAAVRGDPALAAPCLASRALMV